MERPIPPPGYKLVKGKDIKDCVPEGALFWINRWVASTRIGRKPMEWALGEFYAIPSSPESITDEAKTIVEGDRAADYGNVKIAVLRKLGH